MAVVGADALSAREAEVLAALGEHHTNAEIGRLLHISIRTVESHVSSLLRKLDAADRRELAARAPAIIGGADSGPNHSGAGEALRELPATWTTFIGRDAERAAVADALSTNRLVTLLGPGGVGKTRLAVEVARQVSGSFPAGGAFVDLVPVGSEFITNAVAAALDVDEQAQQPLLEVVQGRLRQAPALLVLDNCEHLIAGVAAFVQACLTACPELVVLATSRERLGVVGERVLALGPLTGESEAERLFLDRAAGALGPPVDRQQVAEICRRLDGMPLAIELAAARVGSIGIDGLVAGLDDHLRLLGRSPTSAGHDRLPRGLSAPSAAAGGAARGWPGPARAPCALGSARAGGTWPSARGSGGGAREPCAPACARGREGGPRGRALPAAAPVAIAEL